MVRQALHSGAILLPILYFGAQLVAAPAYSGFNLAGDIASLLGAAASPLAGWFNALVIASGVCAFLGAVGLAAEHALKLAPRLGCGIAMAMIGAGNVWAGLHPLPNPGHAATMLLLGFFLMPLLSLAAACTSAPARTLVVPFAINLAMFGLLAAIQFGAQPKAFMGLLQRLLALTVFVPPALLAWRLLRRREAS